MKLLQAWQILKKSVTSFMEEDAFTYSAAISFYTMLSLPAVLLIVVSIGATLYEENRIQQELIDQISRLIGPSTAGQIEQILAKASIEQQSTLLARTVGIGTLVFSSTTVFFSLQTAINKIWNIEAKPEKGFVKYLLNRLLSLAMVIGIGFILMVSLVVEALLALFKKFVQGFQEELSVILMKVGSEVVSFGIIMVIFSMMYKILPDAKLKWKDVWVGGLITAALFIGGKLLIGVYLGASSFTDAYGASGSLVVMLVWTYYASFIFLFGAKITYIYTKRHGEGIDTYDTAVEVQNVKIETPSE
ncbi:YihY/virulence factor BrkB family protein [Algoriphagus sp. H41]|uniref:YihY/virulence factor BrkB family protein n=1 Tax=Algoriphagus oliviformis TaxID=2811231 RepID=A0ABS3C2B0_9BACT|nr:YihY/virulence factor BrkB family protein [Algoriphagus oliviformis]MBN7810310.1 YihY/virulence factor BrkB family protein [Algoriphagus oliviformis]